MASRKSSNPEQPRRKRRSAEAIPRAFAPFSDADATRIAACYGLLARAAFEIGIKAEGSAKLSRALEDVAAARDALGEIAGRIATIAIVEPSAAKSKASLDALTIQSLVFAAEKAAKGSWDYWRKREQRKRNGEN